MPLPRGDLYEGIYVDDWVSFFRHAARPAPDFWKSPDGDASDRLANTYVKWGVPEKAEKSENCVYRLIAWGKDIDGIEGRSGAPAAKMLRIQWQTLQALLLPRVSRKVLEKLQGAWNDCMMDRRVCAAASDEIHKYTNQQYNATYRWRPAIVDELLTAVIWGPLMFANLRAEESTIIYATDASLPQAGCCSAEAPAAFARELEVRRHTRIQHLA